jgi:hypothetical protein
VILSSIARWCCYEFLRQSATCVAETGNPHPCLSCARRLEKRRAAGRLMPALAATFSMLRSLTMDNDRSNALKRLL